MGCRAVGGSWTLRLPPQPWTRLAPLRSAPVVVCVVFQIRKLDDAEREVSRSESSQWRGEVSWRGAGRGEEAPTAPSRPARPAGTVGGAGRFSTS